MHHYSKKDEDIFAEGMLFLFDEYGQIAYDYAYEQE